MKQNIARLIPQYKSVLYILAFSCIGFGVIVFTKAATPIRSIESESGNLTSCASVLSDSTASNGKAVNFGGDQVCDVGAVLPITYDINNLTGIKYFVSQTGSDTNSGSISAPFATLAKAISIAKTNEIIVIRGGEYQQGNLTVGKTLKIIAYPGETPVFNGANKAVDGWVVEGNLEYIAYTPKEATNGSGICFVKDPTFRWSTGCADIENQNLVADFEGKYPDQAWVGSFELKQVLNKSNLTSGDNFYVDAINNRLYVSTGTKNKGSVEVSGLSSFMKFVAPSTTVEGLEVRRFSNSANDYGVFRYEHLADNSLLKNVSIIDASFIAVNFGGSKDGLIENNKLEHVTIDGANWMGVSANYANGFTMDSVKIININGFGEFANSPQGGALKTSKTHDIVVKNSLISDNNSHGVWFDQSNYNVVVANNTFSDNKGVAVFFEISDSLLLINNYVRVNQINSNSSYQGFRLAGSSGLKIVNNTLVGVREPIGVYTDSRSEPNTGNLNLECYDSTRLTPCVGGLTSDWDKSSRVRPQTMDWKPRIDLMINNIVANPASGGFCYSTDTTVGFCTTVVHKSSSVTNAEVPIERIIHKSNFPYNGLPQTLINGNVYNSSYIFIGNKKYDPLSQFTNEMAISPVIISSLESTGIYGTGLVDATGNPVQTLLEQLNNAVPIPADAQINEYIPAGTKKFGVTTN